MKHHLLRTTKLLAKKVVLQPVENKKQSSCHYHFLRVDTGQTIPSTVHMDTQICRNREDHGIQNTSTLVFWIPLEDACPIEVKNKDRFIRTDLETYQEEANVIIVQQVRS